MTIARVASRTADICRALTQCRFTALVIVLRSVSALALLALLAGCGGDSGETNWTPTPRPTPHPFVRYGVAVVGDDGTGFDSGLQVMKIEDAHGSPLPTPDETFVPIAGLGDIDGMSLTPDGTHGALVDGGNLVYFFSADLSTGTITLSSKTVDVTDYGGDGDSIASLPNGDEVVVSAGSASSSPNANLALISGILSDDPVIAADIATSGQGEYDGLVISADGKVMLSRSASAGVIDVYAIRAVASHPGSLGGTVASSFTLKKTLTGIGMPVPDGRAGMAISPKDSSRAVVVDIAGNANLITGLPDHAALGPALTLPDTAGAVSITPNGKYAIVSILGGLVVLSGVNTGTLAQVGGVYSPSFAVPGGTCTLDEPFTLGVMSDGKYVVAIQNCGLTTSSTDVGPGVLLTIPFAAGALSDPVGQLNYAVAPYNDQLLLH